MLQLAFTSVKECRMSTAVLFQIQSAAILGVMFAGIAARRKRHTHVRLMLLAIIWDLLLILQIELSRGAVAKASQVVANPMMLNIHVSLAVSCVVLYACMGVTGRLLLKGRPKARALHRRLGWTTIVLRLLVFITSFFAVQGVD